MKVLLTAVFLAVSISAHSKPEMDFKAEPGDYAWMTSETFQKEKVKARERSQRKIASAEINDQQISPALKDMRSKFLAVKDYRELEALLQKLDAGYASAPNDLKLVTTMLVPLLKFKAFTYKLYPYLSQEKISHSIFVTMAQNFASFMTMNLPTAQWKAGFDFVTIPSQEDDLKQFKSASDLQNYLIAEVFPAYLKAASRLKSLDLSEAVVWDNRFFYGTASFSDNLARYQLVGEGERLAMLASIHFSLSDMCKFSSYNLQNFLPLISDISKHFGYDSMFMSQVDGINAKKLRGILQKPAYSELYTIRKNGEHNMSVAFYHLKEGSYYLSLSWQELKGRNDANQSFIRAAMFAPFTQLIDSQVDGFVNLTSGKHPVRSDVTGELVSVDVPSFFANPPKDLKTLLPVEFDESPNMQTYVVQMKNGKTKNVKFRNYFSGRALSWDQSAYKTLLPELKKGQDVSHAMRIINQSVSGLMPAILMQPFMLY